MMPNMWSGFRTTSCSRSQKSIALVSLDPFDPNSP